MQKMCPSCSVVNETEGNFCQQCGAPYQQAAPQPMAPPPFAAAVTAPAKKASPAFTITAIVAGSLGIISTYLTWLTWESDYGTVTLNGWDSMKFPEYYDLYSSGAGVALFLSILVAGSGLGHLIRGATSKKPYKSGDRIGVGVVLIIAGLGLIGNAGAQFGAFDEAAKLDLILVEAGAGLSLSALIGAVAIVLGIVVLAVKSVIPVPEAGIR